MMQTATCHLSTCWESVWKTKAKDCPHLQEDAPKRVDRKNRQLSKFQRNRAGASNRGKYRSDTRDRIQHKNIALRERVSAIANGNLRLAIMAASPIADGNFEAIQEPYDLLNIYMNSALAGYSSREQRLAENLAIYDCCDLIEGDPCYEELLGLGYDDAEIRDFASRLNDQEIVTILTSAGGVLAIRMEEQNLRDFFDMPPLRKKKGTAVCRFHSAYRRNAERAVSQSRQVNG